MGSAAPREVRNQMESCISGGEAVARVEWQHQSGVRGVIRSSNTPHAKKAVAAALLLSPPSVAIPPLPLLETLGILCRGVPGVPGEPSSLADPDGEHGGGWPP